MAVSNTAAEGAHEGRSLGHGCIKYCGRGCSRGSLVRTWLYQVLRPRVLTRAPWCASRPALLSCGPCRSDSTREGCVLGCASRPSSTVREGRVPLLQYTGCPGAVTSSSSGVPCCTGRVSCVYVCVCALSCRDCVCALSCRDKLAVERVLRLIRAPGCGPCPAADHAKVAQPIPV